MTPNLESRLRSYFHRRADQLKLPPLEWQQLAQRGNAASADRDQHRFSKWLVAASVAVIVGGGAIGGAVVLRPDDAAAPPESVGAPSVATTEPGDVVVPGPPAESAPVDPLSASRLERPSGASFVGCPADTSPPTELGETPLPDDVRTDGLLLPESTPDGYCVLDHNVNRFGLGLSTYQVWSSCTDCEQPTAAVAVIRDYVAGEFGREGEEVTVGTTGLEGSYFEPDSRNPVARLYTTDALGNEIAVVGWGLEQGEFVAFAAGAISGSTRSGPDRGLEVVYEGELDGWMPETMPVSTQLFVGYYTESGRQAMGYRVSQWIGPPMEAATADDDRMIGPPLMAFAFALPNPTYTETADHATLYFPPSDSYGGQQTVLITQSPDAIVTWESTGDEPLDAEALAAIELSPARIDDPRWMEIAYESGAYLAQG